MIIKARMKDNLVSRYEEFFPGELEAITFEDRAYRKKFLHSIEGKVVELNLIGPNAFEANENDLWLPNSLWDKI